MQEDDRKLNSWWQSQWINSYIKILILGIGLIILAAVPSIVPGMPLVWRMVFIIFGSVLATASYFASKSRWKKM